MHLCFSFPQDQKLQFCIMAFRNISSLSLPVQVQLQTQNFYFICCAVFVLAGRAGYISLDIVIYPMVPFVFVKRSPKETKIWGKSVELHLEPSLLVCFHV
ncbi:hypothetical protein Dimus_014214 [Dionaea muscipula]